MEEERIFLQKIYGKVIEIIEGDITQQDTDAIVNAANSQLVPGGGVSGAIHRAAGKGLWQECRTVGNCPVGEARITGGHHLKAKYVIHTVGPVYSGSAKDKELLERSYYNSLKLAAEKGIKSISFPAVSTGIFGYPVKEAATVAIKTVIMFLKKNDEVELVRFVLFDQNSFEVHKNELAMQMC